MAFLNQQEVASQGLDAGLAKQPSVVVPERWRRQRFEEHCGGGEGSGEEGRGRSWLRQLGSDRDEALLRYVSWSSAGVLEASSESRLARWAYSFLTESPSRLMRWAACTMRSQIASAMVGLADYLMPGRHRQLRYHQRRGSTVAIFEDLQQGQPRVSIQRLQGKVAVVRLRQRHDMLDVGRAAVPLGVNCRTRCRSRVCRPAPFAFMLS